MDSLREEIREINSDLYIVEKLKACSGSVTVVSQTGSFSGDAFCLLLIDYAEQKTDLFVFDTSEEAKANALYAKREKMKAGLQDALLVRVSSLSNLNEAYPNYSSDITYFLKVLEDFLCS